MRKIVAFFMCIGLLFSTSATVFADDTHTVKKFESSVLSGKVTKISQGKIKLSKISDELWSTKLDDKNQDFIILDTTKFNDTEFSDGDSITAYFFTNIILDYKSTADIGDYAFELVAYRNNDQQMTVEEMGRFLVEMRILKGYEDGELHLEQNITRAEFTALMVNAFRLEDYRYILKNENEFNRKPSPFTDVSIDHWAKDYIAYAYNNGMINGKTKDTFIPDESITIKDCIVVLLKASERSEDTRQHLIDTAKALGGYPDGYLKIARENGLIANQSPEKIASRGDVVSILYNAFNHETNFTYVTAGKPVIYLYPQKETNVNVKLSFVGDFTFTYPEYKDGWTVTAKTDGTLISGTRTYPYLFWEGKVLNYSPLFNEGFLVSRKETVTFLEEKLKTLGLNDRERGDFITFWAPRLIENEFNLIKFDTKEYSSKVSLNIDPQPDSVIRIFMVYKGANGNESIKEQKLKTVERKGFVAVEWGGAFEDLK